MMNYNLSIFTIFVFLYFGGVLFSQIKPDTFSLKRFVWPSAPPPDCTFTLSENLKGIRFLELKSGFHFGEPWYPTWGSDGNLYSPWTDGTTYVVYSGNFTTDWNGEKIIPNPPGSHYGMVFQKFEFKLK